MHCISVAGLSKSFGSVSALRGIDLTVSRGEIVALLGPNGAGKTTLLRILGTTVLPDAGQASVVGYDVVSEAGAVRRRIGLMLGDERSWYWRLSGRENLEFFAILQGLSRRRARLRGAELLDDVGLTEAAERRFDGYSSGMRARLSLARALITNPPVLLLDEPSRNLDPSAAADFRATLQQFANQRGTAVLLATHNLHEAAAVAGRVVGLVRGRLAFTRMKTTDASELERVFIAAVG